MDIVDLVFNQSVVTSQHVVSCRVENTRVNPDSLIDELLAATDLKHAVDDPAESEYIVNV